MVLRSMSQIFMRMGELDRALSAIDRALALDATLLIAFSKVEILVARGDPTGAIALLAADVHSARDDTDRAMRVGRLAVLYELTGDSTNALEHAKKAIELGDDLKFLHEPWKKAAAALRTRLPEED